MTLPFSTVRELVRLNLPDSVLRHFGWTNDLAERMEQALNNLDTSAGPSLAILTQKQLLSIYRAQQGN